MIYNIKSYEDISKLKIVSDEDDEKVLLNVFISIDHKCYSKDLIKTFGGEYEKTESIKPTVEIEDLKSSLSMVNGITIQANLYLKNETSKRIVDGIGRLCLKLNNAYMFSDLYLMIYFNGISIESGNDEYSKTKNRLLLFPNNINDVKYKGGIPVYDKKITRYFKEDPKFKYAPKDISALILNNSFKDYIEEGLFIDHLLDNYNFVLTNYVMVVSPNPSKEKRFVYIYSSKGYEPSEDYDEDWHNLIKLLDKKNLWFRNSYKGSNTFNKPYGMKRYIK
jgi:hypothetical protein